MGYIYKDLKVYFNASTWYYEISLLTVFSTYTIYDPWFTPTDVVRYQHGALDPDAADIVPRMYGRRKSHGVIQGFSGDE